MIKKLTNKYEENIENCKKIDKAIERLDELKQKIINAKKELEILVDRYYSKYEINKKQIINTNKDYNKELEGLRQQIEDCINQIDTRRADFNKAYKDNEEYIKLYNKRFDNSLDSYFYQEHSDTKTGTEYLEQYVLNNYIKK